MMCWSNDHPLRPSQCFSSYPINADIQVITFIMIEPLSLKSEPSSISDEKKSKIITAAQLMTKFSLKSPSSNRICLTDREISSTKSISTPKVQRHQIDMFKRVKQNNNNHPQNKNAAGKGERADAKGESKNSCRQKIVKMMNQNKKKNRDKNQNLVMRKSHKDKENQCQSQKMTPLSTQRSHAFKFNICLDNKASLAPLTARHANQQQFFRKSSDASTLSLRTKHTASMQHLDEDHDQLFHRQSSIQLQIDQKGAQNVLKTLQFAKKKLYQQIYSLDKKLLNDYQEIKQNDASRMAKKRQTIMISLKKKDDIINPSKNDKNQ